MIKLYNKFGWGVDGFWVGVVGIIIGKFKEILYFRIFKKKLVDIFIF